jgi:hypothetical protein
MDTFAAIVVGVLISVLGLVVTIACVALGLNVIADFHFSFNEIVGISVAGNVITGNAIATNNS